MSAKMMTCEAYYMRYLAGTEAIQEMLEEARSCRVFSAKRVFGRVLEEAALDSIALVDKETFDYDRFFQSVLRLQAQDAAKNAS